MTAGRRYGHVIDPRSGWPVEGVRSATAVTDEAGPADALATALLVGGLETAAAVCAARPGILALVALDAEPTVLHVFGERDGVEIEPADGLRVVAG